MVVAMNGLPVDWWDQFEPPDGMRAEIIQGELVLSPSPSKPHAVILTRLLWALDRQAPDGYVAVTGLEWRLTEAAVVTQAPIPDILVVPAAGDAVEPILAVEILSPSDMKSIGSGISRAEAKRRDYAAHGLGHYLEVDLRGPCVDRYRAIDGEMGFVSSTYPHQGLLRVREPFEYVLAVENLFEGLG